MNKLFGRIFSFWILIVGIVLLIAALVITASNLLILVDHKETKGNIARIYTYRNCIKTCKYVDHVVVSFMTENGKEMVFEDEIGSTGKRIVGSVIDVSYSGIFPKAATVLYPWVWLIAGIICFPVSFLLISVSVKNAKIMFRPKRSRKK